MDGDSGPPKSPKKRTAEVTYLYALAIPAVITALSPVFVALIR